jgi:transcriptional regulator with XRE-family HTH domain
MDQINHLDRLPMAISDDERAFFTRLGARVAELRKAQDITQVQLAETLSVSQQTINSYEVGRRRIPVSALPLLARTLGVSVEALIGEETASARKRGPTPMWQQKIERLSRLPKTQQKVVMEMLDGLLAQASR